MESSYEIINSSMNHKNITSPHRHAPGMQKSISSVKINQNEKDKNNNQNMTSNKRNEFNPVKISNKLDLNIPTYTSTNSTNSSASHKEYAMKLFSMQQMQHNVDLVVHTYIKKVC